MNAIILAAGTSSRFVPLSYEKPKGLLKVKGEVLIERQIRQLKDAGIKDITIIVGYKADLFFYLMKKFGVKIVFNEDYYRYNNTSSIIRVIDELDDTFICSSDNYFPENIFVGNPIQSYYSALYAEGDTDEYCLTTDDEDNIIDVKIGGANAWYMVGHVFFDKYFSAKFKEIIKEDYALEETRHGYWENVYIHHIQELPPMKMHRYSPNEIMEFDTLDELRRFDESYIYDTHSKLLKQICAIHGWKESQLYDFKQIKESGNTHIFSFMIDGTKYVYDNSAETNLIIK